MARATTKRASTAAARKTARRRISSSAPNQWPSAWRVRIRMYRQGIGDSFLLTFRDPSGSESHVLIDCGVLTGTPSGKQWVQAIATDVIATTGGKVNAIVGTHPHWDHLSGFSDAQSQFQQLKASEVWLSWVENPQDDAAQGQKKHLALQLQTVARAAERLAGLQTAATTSAANRIRSILDFSGPAIAGRAAGSGTQQALDNLRTMFAKAQFFAPGDVIQRDWLPGINVYVLGPPRDEQYLHRMLGKVGSDMYELGPHTGLQAALDAAGPAPRHGGGSGRSAQPFEGGLLVKSDEADRGDAMDGIVSVYERSPWRQIPHDWLLSAETLAANYDNAINNLSLVLAFEFQDTKEVLLFPADAQVGNWQSWQTVRWPAGPDASMPPTTFADSLLARVIFYKVGHHGSHNATLMDHGLEVMSRPELVAAIPVNQDFANSKKRWKMPADGVYKRLQQKAQGRVLRSDGHGTTATDPNCPVAPGVLAEFSTNVSVGPAGPNGAPLYVDYLVRGTE